jgi:hypothetical protein
MESMKMAALPFMQASSCWRSYRGREAAFGFLMLRWQACAINACTLVLYVYNMILVVTAFCHHE